jgi:hypothetical protein
MAEYDLICNLDKGGEFTGFKKLYTDSMLKKGHISEYGHMYNISKLKSSKHILYVLERVEQEDSPEVIMTSNSFFSMNKTLQRKIVNQIIKISKKGTFKLYVGNDVRSLFTNTNVQVSVVCDEKIKSIPHFIVTNEQFNFVLPHTEKKLVRVDINSNSFDSISTQRIIQYFKSLAGDLDNTFINDNNKVDSK